MSEVAEVDRFSISLATQPQLYSATTLARYGHYHQARPYATLALGIIPSLRPAALNATHCSSIPAVASCSVHACTRVEFASISLISRSHDSASMYVSSVPAVLSSLLTGLPRRPYAPLPVLCLLLLLRLRSPMFAAIASPLVPLL